AVPAGAASRLARPQVCPKSLDLATKIRAGSGYAPALHVASTAPAAPAASVTAGYRLPQSSFAPQPLGTVAIVAGASKLRPPSPEAATSIRASPEPSKSTSLASTHPT